MKIHSIDELMTLRRTDEISDLLCTAAHALDCNNPESAAWRLADASKLLRRRLKKHGCVDLHGLDEPTGRGALLGG